MITCSLVLYFPMMPAVFSLPNKEWLSGYKATLPLGEENHSEKTMEEQQVDVSQGLQENEI